VPDEEGRYVLLVQGPNDHGRSLEVEIAGLSVERAEAVHARLDESRSQLNVDRGHLLEVALAAIGTIAPEFAGDPAIGRDEVVLPEAVLERVERHALGVAPPAQDELTWRRRRTSRERSMISSTLASNSPAASLVGNDPDGLPPGGGVGTLPPPHGPAFRHARAVRRFG
jgi:hypothetical protein